MDQCIERGDFAHISLRGLRHMAEVVPAITGWDEASPGRRAITEEIAARQRAAREATARFLRRISKTVRAACGEEGTPYPIEIVDGFSAPIKLGRSYHYRTPGGRSVYHPSAYRRAWGKPVYHASTLRIRVGAGWLLERGFHE